MSFLNVDVPRNCDDRQTVPNWQSVRDALTQVHNVLAEYSVSLPLFPYQRGIPVIGTHLADADTVALWQGDPPGNGSSGLVDSSGHGLTLEYSAGGAGKYCEIGYGQEAFFCDGTNYWRRAASVNDPSLNLVGDMSFGAVVLPSKFSALPMTVVSYGNTLAADTNNDVLFNMNIKDTTTTGIAVDNFALMSHFFQTGAGAGNTANDAKAWPFFRPVHLYWVYDSVAHTLTPYVDGFKQPALTGVAAKAVGGAPVQRITIGADSGALFKFVGAISSVKVSRVKRSDTYVASEAARCLGTGARSISKAEPLMRVAEASELVAAYLTPDADSGTFGAQDFSANLVKLDASGSLNTATTIASIDGSAASGSPWTPFRAKTMRVSPNQKLAVGDTLALSASAKALSGNITLRFRRLV